MENRTESIHVIRFGDFELDLRTGELRCKSHHIILQEKPFQILVALLERPGEMISRKELTERLWPAGTFVDFNLGLNKAVNRLREALDDSAEQPRFIETFPKRGYRFVTPVTRDGAGPGLQSVTFAAHASNGGRAVTGLPADGRPVASHSAEARGGKIYWRWAALAVVAGALA